MAWTKAKMAVITSIVILAACGTAIVTIKQLVSKHTESPADAIKQFSQTPGGALSLDAIRFIKALKLKGQLPGIAVNTVAGIAIPGLIFSHIDGPVLFSNTNLENYPASLKITVHANSLNTLYYYAITKASKTNEWQLQKAWCADTNGIVLKEFPVP
jgi:hypothetical protein